MWGKKVSTTASPDGAPRGRLDPERAERKRERPNLPAPRESRYRTPYDSNGPGVVVGSPARNDQPILELVQQARDLAKIQSMPLNFELGCGRRPAPH